MMNNLNEHLPEGTAAAYVDGRLARDERTRVHAHLAECADCRAEIAAVDHILRPARGNWRMIMPVAAAAAVVLIAINLRNDTPDAPMLRGSETAEVVVVAQPAESAILTATPQFVWRRVTDALEYRVTITNEGGDVVAERVVADTATGVSTMAPGAYRWYVSAILSDGTIRSSRTRAFEVRR